MEQGMQSRLEQMMAWEEQQDKLRAAELEAAEKAREEQQVPFACKRVGERMRTGGGEVKSRMI